MKKEDDCIGSFLWRREEGERERGQEDDSIVS